jgi:propanol-preferring alcohol dehydrogenase
MADATMKAMVLDHLASLDENSKPLRMTRLPIPQPSRDGLQLRVQACGVCHTELDEIEGRLIPPRLPLVLGHEIVGRVTKVGSDVTTYAVGDRVGVGWIHSSCGGPDENLSDAFRATGLHVNGGYAEYMTVPQNYAVPIPKSLSDLEAAPLMCAGAIGYRALRLAGIEDGQPFGLMGFGGSAHLVLQMAKHLYPNSKAFVFDRKKEVQQFAVELGADWAGDIDQSSPSKLAAIIDTTPVWRCVVAAMSNLAPGGRLVINAIRKEDDDQHELLKLSYHEHLWMEREIKTVANLTHQDIADFLPLAAEIPLRPNITTFPLSDANVALGQLRRGGMKGTHVLRID